MEYQEFEPAMRRSGASWPLLERLGRAADGVGAPGHGAQPEAAPSPEAGAQAPAAPHRGSLLGRDGAAEAPSARRPGGEADRRLPLGDVFARLERTGR